MDPSKALCVNMKSILKKKKKKLESQLTHLILDGSFTPSRRPFIIHLTIKEERKASNHLLYAKQWNSWTVLSITSIDAIRAPDNSCAKLKVNNQTFIELESKFLSPNFAFIPVLSV